MSDGKALSTKKPKNLNNLRVVVGDPRTTKQLGGSRGTSTGGTHADEATIIVLAVPLALPLAVARFSLACVPPRRVVYRSIRILDYFKVVSRAPLIIARAALIARGSEGGMEFPLPQDSRQIYWLQRRLHVMWFLLLSLASIAGPGHTRIASA